MSLSTVATIAITTLACGMFMLAPFKQQAVELGVAEWKVVDNSSGMTKFVWKNAEDKLVRFTF